MTLAYRPFRRVLIANRGEIACRVMRAAQSLGLETVAVYSEQDKSSLHVAMADQALCIGPAQASASYLNIEALCTAIHQSGADAVHPGYGFLAENAVFAQAVLDAGAVWVGPRPHSIDAMGNKARAKEMMLAAGVSCIPGYEGQDQSLATLLRHATNIGFPLMVKAAAGGGGRGMRLVLSADQLPLALERARAESMQAFGSEELILERAMLNARHVEIQIAGDVSGHVLHFGERDCSIQRRHQKLIEESPSPAVDESLRARMGAMAVQAASAIQYVGVGTVECLLTEDGSFYFMEMNTRLQVEHAVTEAIYDMDLVALQFALASGKDLPLTQQQVVSKGHAIEVRLTAEDVHAGFLPQSGMVHRWRSVEQLEGIRVDHCLRDGTYVSPYYDSMIAKIIAVGETRDQAIARLTVALKKCVVLGIPTNQPFLLACLAHPQFRAGMATTGFVESTSHQGLLDDNMPEPLVMMWAAVAAKGLVDDIDEPSCSRTGHAERRLASVISTTRLSLHPSLLTKSGSAHALAAHWIVKLQARPDGLLQARLGADDERPEQDWVVLASLPKDFEYVSDQNFVHVFVSGQAWTFEIAQPGASAYPALATSGLVRAPLGARVASVFVSSGQRVQAGQTLAVLEAMKMEHAMTAPFEGTVTELFIQAGTQVRAGAQLLTISDAESSGG